jgi:hypothetical protein
MARENGLTPMVHLYLKNADEPPGYLSCSVLFTWVLVFPF